MAAPLDAIAAAVGTVAPTGTGDVMITDVTHDSRSVRAGSLFVAYPGTRHDGHDHVGAAVGAGCAAVLVERPTNAGVPELVVGDARAAMAWAAREVHGRPDRSLTIVGVTGTNGKTTVTHLCEAVWRSVGEPYGIIGTLGARYEDTPVPLARTTPESSDLQRLLGTMAAGGVRSVAMEVSSHALALHRADAIRFVAVGFTNLTHDHLDFHGTMDRYLATKQRLFEPGRAERAVVAIGDDAGRTVAAETELPVLTTGLTPEADVWASEIAATPVGTTFVLNTAAGSFPAFLPLVGRFNVENALVATGLMMSGGLGPAAIADGLGRADAIPGRMEVIGHDGPCTVIVDYAHTPDAIDRVLEAVSDMARGRLIAVVGAGGDRDAGKREAMGASAASHADITIVTTDNPRSEDPVEIARRVQEGALAVRRSDVRMVLDRREAIDAAIDAADVDDIVMILGKGHEQGQEIMGNVLPFDDRDAARAALRRAGWEPR